VFFVTKIKLSRLDTISWTNVLIYEPNRVLQITAFSRQSLSISKRLLISTEEAEDATQEILVKLWSKTKFGCH
jgi:RNA polymerase sigma-70 factor (ECF subfamily)